MGRQVGRPSHEGEESRFCMKRKSDFWLAPLANRSLGGRADELRMAGWPRASASTA